jgi:hypothetical protein
MKKYLNFFDLELAGVSDGDSNPNQLKEMTCIIDGQ